MKQMAVPVNETIRPRMPEDRIFIFTAVRISDHAIFRWLINFKLIRFVKPFICFVFH